MRFKRTRHIAFRVLAGKAYVIDTDTSTLHEFNETATALWEALSRPVSAQQLAGRLADTYDVSPEEAARDVDLFLSELARKRLIEHE